ncbi:MAG: hypothetical protein IKF01_01910 [Bacilli bacterium]|nr:hypothetical protein [Bacilli bacterium]
MIDIHSHLLYGVDDGSKSLEESVDIIRNMEKEGFTDIILTPHYISGSNYASSKRNNIKLLNELKRCLRDNNVDVNLFLGNEIYIDDNIYDLLKEREISSLNDSVFLLIELPMSGEYEGYIDLFDYLMSKGYKVILAHPERYHSFQNDFNRIYELERIGVYFQCNFESILGSYGKGAIKTVKRLLKEKKISFIASDIHHRKHDYTKFSKAKKKMRRYLSKGELNVLLNENPSKIIN